ncbi:MAG: phosphotransferase [Oscillospiraceae bacterium]|nr:phosphotransferase [Oscillospiraceae bacterium]
MPEKKIYDTIIKSEPITKGWSSDKKYCVETSNGQRMLLRVSDITEFDRKKVEYGMMERVYGFGVLTSEPIEFGLCNNGENCYSLSGWLDGKNAEEVLPFMSETEQYVFGLKAGEILREIHTLSAPENAEPWCDWFYRKVQGRIDFYNANSIKSENADIIVRYLQKNKRLLDGRPQAFNHGDFNKSNLMVTPDGQIGVIDFNCYNKDHGDPWWEFDPTNWGNEANKHYCTGLIKGYFTGEPPQEFFNLFSYYLAYDALAALCDTSVGNQGKPEEGIRHLKNILRWFDNMNNPVPSWYIKDFHVQYTDGVPYKLKSPFDFSFLKKYGKVFKVYDDQDSGNICFGVTDGESKYFVKFAGAPTERANVSPTEAVNRMKSTAQIYRDLAHPILTKLIDTEEIGGGYAMVFEWTDAECMGKQYPASREKFAQIPIDTKLQVFDDILAFHAHVAKQGYIAIDFYDGSIMYDFNNDRTIICDIEFYAKVPYINEMGRMWGSSRFMSPEEFQFGAVIDEITNVYTMGATAFALFGDECDRCIEKWRLSKELYAAAKKAVSDERGKRQQSIQQFIEKWREAK